MSNTTSEVFIFNKDRRFPHNKGFTCKYPDGNEVPKNLIPALVTEAEEILNQFGVVAVGIDGSIHPDWRMNKKHK